MIHAPYIRFASDADAAAAKRKEIAERLFLSEGTVRNYLTTVLGKLDLRDRTQVAVFYLRKRQERS